MADIIGYERTEPHYLHGTWQRRYCLECMAILPGMAAPVIPITREALLEQLRPHRVEGYTNVGGMELCSKCGKRLVYRGDPTPEEAQETDNRMEEIETAVAMLLDLPYLTDKECERLHRIAGDLYRIRHALVRRADAQPKPV